MCACFINAVDVSARQAAPQRDFRSGRDPEIVRGGVRAEGHSRTVDDVEITGNFCRNRARAGNVQLAVGERDGRGIQRGVAEFHGRADDAEIGSRLQQRIVGDLERGDLTGVVFGADDHVVGCDNL